MTDRVRTGGSWPLTAATLLVLAGGYGWLGSFVAGRYGALVGSACGLALSGLLYALVEMAISGPRAMRRHRRRARC
ncbi:hypothetical protein ACHBTE_00540 [Streptomyces sp. M41]|uniref:hypothetical protein n=1 Tax=Streptomyces sp. M41 TaxID=3059412 RepID=UPI00374D2D1B